jgi:hypothetical protein
MVPCPECMFPLDDKKFLDVGIIECVQCENRVALCPLTETPVTLDEMPLTEYLGG